MPRRKSTQLVPVHHGGPATTPTQPAQNGGLMRARRRRLVPRQAKPTWVDHATEAFKELGAVIVGAGAGAVAGGILVAGLGVSPKAAAITTTLGGAAGALLTSGGWRAAMGGTVAAGAGQMAIAFMAKRQKDKQQTAAAETPAKKAPANAPAPDWRQAWEDAGRQIDQEYDDDDDDEDDTTHVVVMPTAA